MTSVYVVVSVLDDSNQIVFDVVPAIGEEHAARLITNVRGSAGLSICMGTVEEVATWVERLPRTVTEARKTFDLLNKVHTVRK